MKIIINDINKCNLFCNLMSRIAIKTTIDDNFINVYFNEEEIVINGIFYSCDTCIFENKIKSNWFDEYEYDKINDPLVLIIDIIELSKILNYYENNDIIKIYTNNDNPNKLIIEFVDIINDINKYFELSYLDNVQNNNLNIISEEMDVEIVIKLNVVKSILKFINNNNNIIIDLNNELLRIYNSLVNKEQELIIKKGDNFYYTTGEGINILEKVCCNFLQVLNLLIVLTFLSNNNNDLVMGFKKNKQMKVTYNIVEDVSLSFYTKTINSENDE